MLDQTRYGELAFMKACEINEKGEPILGGVERHFLYDKGSKAIVFINPEHESFEYLVDRKAKILARRK